MKILKIINKLSASEKRRVKEAIGSPFFNKNEKLTLLWDTLVNSKDESSAEIKVAIHKAIFKKEQYDDLVIRHLLSKLQKLLEEIIGIMMLQDNNQSVSLSYTHWLNQQELLDLHEQQMDRVSQDTPRSLDGYYWQYHWKEELEYTERKHNAQYDNKMMAAVSESFDQYYIANKLKMACIAANESGIRKGANSLLDKIVTSYERREPFEPVILCYYLAYQMFTVNDSEEYFIRLKTTLPLPSLPIDKQERSVLFELALKYCLTNIKNGKANYFDEVFDIYEAMLSLSLVTHNEVYFPSILEQLATKALILNATDWAYKLCNAHVTHFEIPNAENYINYNLALTQFKNGHFKNAAQLLEHITLPTVHSLTLLAQVLYELGKVNDAEKQLESLKRIAGSKDTTLAEKQHGQAIYKYLKTLVSLDGDDKAMKKMLQNQINGEDALNESKWILEKLEAIE